MRMAGKSKKKALNLSLAPELIKWAEEIAEARHYRHLSDLVEELIRQKHDELFPAGKGQNPSSRPVRGEAVQFLKKALRDRKTENPE